MIQIWKWFDFFRLKDGNIPTSYEDFVMYLKEKDLQIQEENLSFLGKNKVLFLKHGDQNQNCK